MKIDFLKNVHLYIFIFLKICLLSACDQVIIEDQKLCHESLSCELGYDCKNGTCVKSNAQQNITSFKFKREAPPPAPNLYLSDSLGDQTNIDLKKCEFDKANLTIPYLPNAPLKLFKTFCIGQHLFVFASELFKSDYAEELRSAMGDPNHRISFLTKAFFNGLTDSPITDPSSDSIDRKNVLYHYMHNQATLDNDVEPSSDQKFSPITIMPFDGDVKDVLNENEPIQNEQMIDIRLLTKIETDVANSDLNMEMDPTQKDFIVIYNTKINGLSGTYLSSNQKMNLIKLSYQNASFSASPLFKDTDNTNFFGNYVLFKDSIYAWTLDTNQTIRKLVQFKFKQENQENNQNQTVVAIKEVCTLEPITIYPSNLTLIADPINQDRSSGLLFYFTKAVGSLDFDQFNLIDLSKIELDNMNQATNMPSCQNQYELLNKTSFDAKSTDMKQKFKDFDLINAKKSSRAMLNNYATNTFTDTSSNEYGLRFHTFEKKYPFEEMQYLSFSLILGSFTPNAEDQIQWNEWNDQKIWLNEDNLFFTKTKDFSEILIQCPLDRSANRNEEDENIKQTLRYCTDTGLELDESYETESQLIDIHFYEAPPNQTSLLIASQTYSNFSQSLKDLNLDPILVWDFAFKKVSK